MKGTEKQIAWANDIRNNIIATCDCNITRFRDTIPEDSATFIAIKDRCVEVLAKLEKLPQADEAKFWIDNRDRLPNPLKIFEKVNLMVFNGKSLEEALKAIFGF